MVRYSVAPKLGVADRLKRLWNSMVILLGGFAT